MTQKLRKLGFFAQKRDIFSQNSVFDEIQFSQKSLINRKNQPHALPQQFLVQQISKVLCCYYKPPRSGSTGKETKIQKEGARGGRVYLTKMKTQYQTFQTRYSSFVWYA